MNKQWGLYFLVFFILINFLFYSGCSKPEIVSQSYSLEEPTEQKVTIRFINSWGGLDTKADALNSVFSNFMQNNPDIIVVNEALKGEDFLLKLKTDFASGNDPDVFGIWPGTDIEALIKANKVADLTPYLNLDPQWKDSFYDEMWHLATFNDRIYGLPMEVIFEGMFINMDLFKKFKLTLPTNFQQLKESVVAFRRNGIIPIAFNSKPEGSFLYQNIVTMLGTEEEVKNPFKNGDISECYVKAMGYVKELYSLGAFPQDAFTLTDEERDDLFLNGEAAMIVQGSWLVGNLEGNDHVDFIPFPWVGEENTFYPTIVYGLGGGVFYMSQNASENVKKKEASIRLLKHITQKETAEYFAESTGMLSNVKIDFSSVEYSPLVEKGRGFVEISPKVLAPPDHFVNRTVWEDVVVELFPYYLTGSFNANDVWQRAYQKNQQLIKAGEQ